MCQSLVEHFNVKVPLNEAPICSSRTAHYVCFISTQTDWKCASSPTKVGTAVTALQNPFCPNGEDLLFRRCFIHSWVSLPSTWSARTSHLNPVTNQVIIMERNDSALNCLGGFLPPECPKFHLIYILS